MADASMSPPTGGRSAGVGRVLTAAQRQRRTIRQMLDPGVDLRTLHDDSEIAMLRRKGGLPTGPAARPKLPTGQQRLLASVQQKRRQKGGVAGGRPVAAASPPPSNSGLSSY